MSDSGYGFPEDMDTAKVERARADQRVESADEATQRTNIVLGWLEAAYAGAASLHMENGYAPKIRAIFRS